MIKKLLEIMAIALIVAGVAGAYFKWMGALPISVTTTAKQTTFDVTGEGKVVVVPDQAEMSLGIQKTGASVADVQKQVNTTMDELTKQLKGLGIADSDIKTTSYNVYPNYQPGKAGQYSVAAQVSVKTKDFAVASKVLDLAGTLSLNQVGGIQFSLSDELKDKTTKEARSQAIDAAKKKATELAGLSGMTLGRIVNVSEGMGSVPRPIMHAAQAKSADAVASAPTPVEPGTNEVDVTVTLSYETR
jgi:hypothetical protein